MNINEVLQGMSNLGGETPRVTKPKRIKEIKPGKKHKNFRKPKGPLNIDLSKVFAIGDSIRDIKAALASGCKPLGVKTGNGSELSDEIPDLDIFDDLFDAAQFVIENDKQYTLNI